MFYHKWGENELVLVAEDEELSFTPDGYSRFEDDLDFAERGMPKEDRRDPILFSSWAWTVATPQANPSLVWLRPDIEKVELVTCPYDGTLVAEVTARLPHSSLTAKRRPGAEARDWAVHFESGNFPGLWPPRDNDPDPAVLCRAVARVSGRSWRIPVPESLGWDDAKATARRAVQAIAESVNRDAGPHVERVLGRAETLPGAARQRGGLTGV